MRMILAALFCCWCGHALAQTAQELIDNPKNGENVTTFGMGYHLNQYSSLNQINKSNIKRLVPIWSTSLSNDAGELAQPTIYNGVMYVVNGKRPFVAGKLLRQLALRFIVRDGAETATVSCIIGTQRPSGVASGPEPRQI